MAGMERGIARIYQTRSWHAELSP
ncbi:MAG: hypothetical protein K0S21_1646, partial [Rhizobiaceae bacterium]|nr:hypothetical protein [Rhizobiaceae bacterium]